jgi:hypothetical protein
MADFDDLFDWIEDAFEDLFEDGPEAIIESARAKALLGGCLFAVLATIAFGLLSSFATVFSSSGGMFLAAWLVGGALIYFYIIRTGSKRYREGEDIRERHEQREREPHRAEQEPTGRSDHEATEEPPQTADVGDVVLLILAGLGLALCAGFLVTGRAGASTLNMILTSLLGALGAGSVLSLLLRWRGAGAIAAEESDRQVRAQMKRIRAKCGRLRKRAKKVGGLYSGLPRHANEMRRRAEELAETIDRLRKGLREIERSDNPTLPPGAEPDAEDERLRSEYEAARQTQARLHEVMERNRRQERLCLVRLERIEDLLDAAHLEMMHPATDHAIEGVGDTVAEDLEAELELSREALEEVRGQSELRA